MICIDEVLNKLFDYKEVITGPYAMMREVTRIHSEKNKIPFTNVKLSRFDYYGIADFCMPGTKGLVIYHYAYDKAVRRKGEQLPEPFQELQNCEHHHYGIRLNLLAYLSGQRIDGLFIRDLYNGETIQVRPNLTLAERFISGFNQINREPEVSMVGMLETELKTQRELFV